tara:strand:- start:414 stop:854 length:441 start_codon:yes stop_codon:yes gene_type:complete
LTEKEYHEPDIGETFTDDYGKYSLYEAFRCQTSGGIRYTNKNNFVILIDSPNSLYDDRVDEKTIFYHGTGEGDQGFKYDPDKKRSGFAFNAKVKDPDSILLYFEKPKRNHLVFRHKAEYVNHTYKKTPNRKGEMRKTIIFKLKIIK